MPSAATALAKLEPVAIRTVWPSEASDFTPWLSQEDNIALLSEAIGLDLEVAAREMPVGPFRADILCKDVATDHWVLVENQLECSDHIHMGQLITYAAGLEAVTIVWIAREFKDEHLAAIQWLNEITAERFSFFAIEIEAWRIGPSPVAPRFNVVARPNDWSRSIEREVERETELSQGRQTQLEYWTVFKEFLEAQQSQLRSQTPLPQGWSAFAIGTSGYRLAATIVIRRRSIHVGLYLETSAAKECFRKLEAEKEAIEAEVGEPLEWLELPHRNRSQIELRREADVNNREDWPQQHRWLTERLEKFRRAFAERIRAYESGG